MRAVGRTRAARRRVGLAVLAAALLAAACTDAGDDGAARPSRPVEERPPIVDYSGTELARVKGTTTTAALPETGTASIVGSVTGPNGLVVGATVRIEHLVGSGRSVPRDVLTGPDGRYAVAGIPGGRYRVRAFLVPALAVAEPDVRFLPDGQEAVFDLTVVDRRKVVASASVSPSVPYVGEAVNLAVVVATQAVDVDGVVRSTPIPGLRVELDGLGAWSLRRDDGVRTPFPPRSSTTTTFTFPESSTAFTDGSGVVRYQLRCNAAGRPGLGLLVTVTVTPAPVEGEPPPVPEQRVDRIGLALPECIDPTATTLPPATSSTRPPAAADG